jgi:hypothetical protein
MKMIRNSRRIMAPPTPATNGMSKLSVPAGTMVTAMVGVVTSMGVVASTGMARVMICSKMVNVTVIL